MRQTVVITDLTQMKGGDYVCIAGINESGQCIRPVAEDREKGVPKDLLYHKSQLIVCPRAKVEFDFHSVKVEPPHVEDRGFDPNHIVSKGFCSSTEWEDILRNSSKTTVDAIYDGLLEEHKWVRPGAKTRSIATLSRVTVVNVQLPEWDGKLKYRLSFKDDTGNVFDCPVSDLTFRELCYKRIKGDGHPRLTVSGELTSLLKNAHRVYLRLGLARPFRVAPTTEPRCYLQVTGIYTFPDYLPGKTFADF
ncbi:MAG: hypothetical protein MUO99_03830 [Dehalococcoidales bacterium]|nr:hypothetical protein [Dehalococcoidales bacterium]